MSDSGLHKQAQQLAVAFDEAARHARDGKCSGAVWHGSKDFPMPRGETSRRRIMDSTSRWLAERLRRIGRCKMLAAEAGIQYP